MWRSELLPSDLQRMDYVRPRVLRSVRKRLIYAFLLAVLVGGVVVVASPVDAAGLALLTFVLTVGVVGMGAYSRHSERWQWWQAGGGIERLEKTDRAAHPASTR